MSAESFNVSQERKSIVNLQISLSIISAFATIWPDWTNFAVHPLFVVSSDAPNTPSVFWCPRIVLPWSYKNKLHVRRFAANTTQSTVSQPCKIQGMGNCTAQHFANYACNRVSNVCVFEYRPQIDLSVEIRHYQTDGGGFNLKSWPCLIFELQPWSYIK